MIMKKKYPEISAFFRNRFRGFFREKEELAAHTWYKIGGPADFFALPMTRDALVDLVQRCRELEFPVYFLGDGSNILVSDDGYRGVVISLKGFFNRISISGNVLEIDAGVMLQDLVLFCEQRNLGGLEYLSGIPGTVGGALIMNAGTSNGEIGDRIENVYFIDSDLEASALGKNEISFGYRKAPELQNHVIIGCRLYLEFQEERLLRQRRITQIEKRAAKQPLEYPSCGSVFKRPPENYVGSMVEELGLKGIRHGDAMISEKHGGFIINLGKAKATDVLYLIRMIQEKISKHYSVELEPEVRFVGFEEN